MVQTVWHCVIRNLISFAFFNFYGVQIPVLLMIFVELLALVKSQNFTYVGFKRCGVVALMILIPILVESLALVTSNVCIFLWRCGVEDPRKKSSRKKPKFHLCGFQTLWRCGVDDSRRITCSRKKSKFHLCVFQTLWRCGVDDSHTNPRRISCSRKF